MAYRATVIPVMIASPSDVPAERLIIREVINEWNYVNSRTRKVVLMPAGWESHSAPEIGSHGAQELINNRVLEYCDLLIGVFWTRLGTPTGRAPSGTAEEIQRHIEAGKPALVYFSAAPVVPDSLDQEQYAALGEFKNWCQARGLVQPFADRFDFRHMFANQISLTMNENPLLRKLQSLSDQEDSKPSPDIAEAGTREVTLSGDAVELLAAMVADRHGSLMRIHSLSGLSIVVNGRDFVEHGDRRSEARWEAVLEKLESYGLLRDAGYEREVFQLTANGYEAGDRAKALIDEQAGQMSQNETNIN